MGGGGINTLETIQEYKDIYLPMTFKCTQEFVLVTLHSIVLLICIDKKARECGVRRRKCVIVILGRIVNVLDVHLLSSTDMYHSVYRGLVIVAMLRVRYPHSHHLVAHIDRAVGIQTCTKAVGQKGCLEVVET